MQVDACSNTDCFISVVREIDRVYLRPSDVLVVQLCNYDIHMSLVAPEPYIDAYLTFVQGSGFS